MIIQQSTWYKVYKENSSIFLTILKCLGSVKTIDLTEMEWEFLVVIWPSLTRKPSFLSFRKCYLLVVRSWTSSNTKYWAMNKNIVAIHMHIKLIHWECYVLVSPNSWTYFPWLASPQYSQNSFCWVAEVWYMYWCHQSLCNVFDKVSLISPV